MQLFQHLQIQLPGNIVMEKVSNNNYFAWKFLTASWAFIDYVMTYLIRDDSISLSAEKRSRFHLTCGRRRRSSLRLHRILLHHMKRIRKHYRANRKHKTIFYVLLKVLQTFGRATGWGTLEDFTFSIAASTALVPPIKFGWQVFM